MGYVFLILAIFILFVVLRSVRIVPQARRGIVERLGKYHRTLEPGLTLVVPFIDKVQPLIDMREQVVTFPPQPVITADNVTVQIDTVIYFTITDPQAVSYEIANPLQAIEQLTITTLRNVVGGMTSSSRSPAATRSTPSCAPSSTRRRASGVSASPPSRSRRSIRRPRSRRRWRSRCVPSVTSAPRSSTPRACASRRSSRLRVSGSRTSFARRVSGRPRSSPLRVTVSRRS